MAPCDVARLGELNPRCSSAPDRRAALATPASTGSSTAGQRARTARAARARARFVPASERAKGERAARSARRRTRERARWRARSARWRLVPALDRGDPSESEVRRRLRRRAPSRAPRIAAGSLRDRRPRTAPRRASRARAGSRATAASAASEPRGGFRVPCEALEDDAIQVVPFEVARRQRLRARVGLVRGVPLLPGMQHPAERADRCRVRRAARRRHVYARAIASRAAAGKVDRAQAPAAAGHALGLNRRRRQGRRRESRPGELVDERMRLSIPTPRRPPENENPVGSAPPGFAVRISAEHQLRASV